MGWGWGEKAAEGLIDRSNVALVKNVRGAACQGGVLKNTPKARLPPVKALPGCCAVGPTKNPTPRKFTPSLGRVMQMSLWVVRPCKAGAQVKIARGQPTHSGVRVGWVTAGGGASRK